MFVLCVVEKGQKTKPGPSGQSSTDKVQREREKRNPAEGMDVCLL